MRCISCRKSIPNEASKCTECGSFQNKYIYYLFNITGLIKPILEVAPIVGIAVSLWVLAFPKSAEIELVAECQEKKIYLTAVNKGGQVGAIVQPTLYENRDGKVELSHVALSSKNGLSQILKPGDGVVIEYEAKQGQYDNVAFPQKGNSSDCHLEINYSVINFEKTSKGYKSKKAICSCWDNKL